MKTLSRWKLFLSRNLFQCLIKLLFYNFLQVVDMLVICWLHFRFCHFKLWYESRVRNTIVMWILGGEPQNQSLPEGIMSCPPSSLNTFLRWNRIVPSLFHCVLKPLQYNLTWNLLTAHKTRRIYHSSFYRERVSVALLRFQAITILRWADVVSWRGLF